MKSHRVFYMLNFRKVRSYEAHFAAVAAGRGRTLNSPSRDIAVIEKPHLRRRE